jgi:hypothetical protein
MTQVTEMLTYLFLKTTETQILSEQNKRYNHLKVNPEA